MEFPEPLAWDTRAFPRYCGVIWAFDEERRMRIITAGRVRYGGNIGTGVRFVEESM